MPYLGKSPSFGVRQRYQYTATASQTTFSGTDTANLTLNYTDNNFVDVFQNGVLLKGGGNDYTATSGTSVVLATGATADDVIEIIVYDAFSAGNFYSRTDSDSRYLNVAGDTMTGSLDLNGTELVLDADGDTTIHADTDDQIDFKVGGTDVMAMSTTGLTITNAANTAQLELVSTDADSGIGPHQVFYRNSASPADADLLCELDFRGRNDNSQDVDYAVINVKANDVTDGEEDGEFVLQVQTAGSVDTTMHIKPDEIVFNEDSIDRDFRVESNGNANAFYVNAGDETVHFFTTDGNPGNNTSGIGTIINNEGKFLNAVNQSECAVFNRMGSDGDVVLIRQAGATEGGISVSGSTVSFNGFSGLHESSGIATNTPIGTVVSTIDELDTYPTGTTKEGRTRADHAKVEVSDTVGDSAVYGVVSRFDDNDKVFVASVGIGSVRVTGACAKGDLLESNGDGTAKVQSDDIVRSKTIGKVTIGNSSTGVKLVSCVLYCG